jgi:hypothetical protein
MKFYRSQHPRVPNVLTTGSFFLAACGALGSFIPSDCEIRVSIRLDHRNHTYFDVRSMYVLIYHHTRTTLTPVPPAMTWGLLCTTSIQI